MVKDGRAEFGCSLEQWAEGNVPGPRAGLLPKMARAIGAVIPPLSVVADVPALPARVDWGRWCVDCPCGGAQMVWLEGPHLTWCAACGNAETGGAWRPVLVPVDYATISRELDTRPLVKDQQWRAEG